MIADYRLEVSVCMCDLQDFGYLFLSCFLVKIRFNSLIFLLLKSITIIIVKKILACSI